MPVAGRRRTFQIDFLKNGYGEGRYDIALNEDNRRQRAVTLCRHLIDGVPVFWSTEARLRGNWDDGQIERMSARLGCKLQISAATNAGRQATPYVTIWDSSR